MYNDTMKRGTTSIEAGWEPVSTFRYNGHARMLEKGDIGQCVP